MVLANTSTVWADSYAIKNVKHLFDLKRGGGKALALPTDIAVNKQTIYVLDGVNNRVVAYNRSGKYLFSIGGKGETAGLFNTPVGMTVHGDKIYVADTAHHQVHILSLRGKLITSINIFSEGREERPIDVAVSKGGREIFVTCNNSQQIHVYNPQGKLLRKWGKRGKKEGDFRYPATIANTKKKGKVVVDVLNSRAQVFSDAGKFLRTIGGQGVIAGKFFRPKGVTVDKKGRIYVSDSVMELIQVFDSDGTLLHILGKNNKIRRFNAPAGITYHNGRLYVAEVLGNKISVFGIR